VAAAVAALDALGGAVSGLFGVGVGGAAFCTIAVGLTGGAAGLAGGVVTFATFGDIGAGDGLVSTTALMTGAGGTATDGAAFCNGAALAGGALFSLITTGVSTTATGAVALGDPTQPETNSANKIAPTPGTRIESVFVQDIFSISSLLSISKLQQSATISRLALLVGGSRAGKRSFNPPKRAQHVS